jgi:ABC-2 type transport system permease protein
MRASVLQRGLRDSRRAFVWWAIGILGYVVLIASVWPTVRDNPALKKLHETYPQALKAFVSFGGEFDFSTAAGYLGAELFSLVVPLLLMIAAIGSGARAIAGEEEAGTLDLLLANPISRTWLAFEKLAVVIVEMLFLAGVLWLALWASARIFDMEISGVHLLAAVVSAALLAVAFGAIATAVGAGTGRRVVAITTCAALALASYLINALAPLVGAIDRIRWLSPWYHYAGADPLRHGIDVGHAAVLVVIIVVATIAFPLAFERSDLS